MLLYLEISNLNKYAMMQCKTKNENLAHILGYKIWAVPEGRAVMDDACTEGFQGDVARPDEVSFQESANLFLDPVIYCRVELTSWLFIWPEAGF